MTSFTRVSSAKLSAAKAGLLFSRNLNLVLVHVDDDQAKAFGIEPGWHYFESHNGTWSLWDGTAKKAGTDM